MGTALYKIILAYNGTAFAGFQRQAAARTVQAELETALEKLDWQGSTILAAGRTDAGVHARGQVVSFYLDWKHSPENLRNALNHYLPNDMAVQFACEAPTDFHPRFDAKWRHYRYRIFCQPVRDPLRADFSWRVWPGVQVDRMSAAAADLVGSRDFRAFGSPMTEGGGTIREVFQATWSCDGDEFYFDITANAFLYHMVRRIVFALVTVGQNLAPISVVAEGLTNGELALTGLAPSAGLVLEAVGY
ncbi:MAG: tRNA pseudouridine(38-40) synthase TruA [Anaerolineaceae bacterium]